MRRAPTWTMRCAAMLAREIRELEAERLAIACDGGLGLAAVAAVAALPPGPARAVEAARWLRLAEQRGIEHVATPIVGGESDDELDAIAEIHFQCGSRAA